MGDREGRPYFGLCRSKHIARVASARRHAQAIYELALESNELDAWGQNLQRIDAVLTDPALLSVLEAPKISFEAKKQLLQEKLVAISPLAMNLVYFLVVKTRLFLLHGIVSQYERMVDAYYGIEHAEVVTPFLIDENERTALGESLAGVLGKNKVILKTRVDPAIVGGMVARIGDTLIDGSTRTKLHSLKRSLESGATVV